MSDINKLYEEMINPTKIEKKPLNETGEMSKYDIEEGGEFYEMANRVKKDMLWLELHSNDKLIFIDVKPYDKYQGVYAVVKINGKNYEVWMANSWDENMDGEYWIEDYPIDNTSSDDTLAGFQGTREEILDVLENNIQESKNKSSIKEASSKNTREEIFTDYKQVDGKWEPIEYKFTFKKKTTGINKILLFALHGGGIHRMNTVGDGYYWFEGLEHGDWYSGGWYYKPMISKNIDGFVDMEDRSVWVKVGEPEIIGESDKKYPSDMKSFIKDTKKANGKILKVIRNDKNSGYVVYYRNNDEYANSSKTKAFSDEKKPKGDK